MYLSVCAVFILIGTTLGKKNNLNPGIQTKITQKGLEYGKQVAVTVAEQKIREFPLPEISGTISQFGLKYRVNGMRVRSFGLPVSDVGLIPNTGFKSSVEKAYIGISGNWHTIFGLIHDGGTFDLNINDLSATFIVGVSLDTSRPMITYNDCGATLGDLDLKMYGGGSWFYKMFLGKVKDLIRQMIPKQLCSEFRHTVGKLEDVIQTLRVSWQLDKFVEFDYSLVGEPEITTDFIDFPIKGELYDVQHHMEAPFTAQLFNLSNTTNQMLVVGLSEYSVNTGGFAYFVAGALQINITNDMIPKDIPFQLNTSSLNFLLPEVAKEYPNLLMKVVMSATKQPIVKLVPGKFSSNVFTAAEVFVIFPNNSLAELFLLGITASVSGQVYTSYGKLHGSVSLSSVDLTLEESKVGTVPVKSLETVLKLGLEKIVIPKINAKLKEGLSIPKIDKIALINPIIEIDQNSISVTIGKVERLEQVNGRMEFLEDGFMFPMGDSSIPPMGDSYMPQMSNWFMPPMSDSFIPPMSECYMPQIGDNFMLPMGANFMLPNSDCYMDSAVIENEAAFQPNYEDILNTISGQIDMEQASRGIQKQQIIRKAPLGRGMYMQNTVTVPNMGHVQMDLAGNNIGWVDERSRQGNQQQFAQPHANEQRTNERISADLPGARDVAEVCCADPECLLEICSCIFQSCCCCAEQ